MPADVPTRTYQRLPAADLDARDALIVEAWKGGPVSARELVDLIAVRLPEANRIAPATTKRINQRVFELQRIGRLPKGDRTRQRMQAAVDRDAAIVAVAAAQSRRLGVRSVFYLCVAAGVVEKTEAAYNHVSNALTAARRARVLPMDAIVDDGRPVALWPPEAPSSDLVTVEEYDYDDAAEFAEARVERAIDAPEFDAGEAPALFVPLAPDELAETIRDHEDLPALETHCERWDGAPVVPIVLLEKSGLAGILGPVCEAAGVPLISTKGYSSLTLNRDLHRRMQAAAGAWRWRLLCVFDHDSSGDGIPACVCGDLERFDRWIVDDDPGAVPAAWDWERIALTADQIAEYDLPTRPAKRAGDADACEVDALPPDALASIVGAAITNLYPADMRRRRADAERSARLAHRERVEGIVEAAVEVGFDPVYATAAERAFIREAQRRHAEFVAWFDAETKGGA